MDVSNPNEYVRSPRAIHCAAMLHGQCQTSHPAYMRARFAALQRGRSQEQVGLHKKKTPYHQVVVSNRNFLCTWDIIAILKFIHF